MAYVETLFGHQAEIVSIHSLSRERVVTGGRDLSMRFWKIPEETQLLFKGHMGSVDTVCMLSSDQLMSGSQDGTVAMWDLMRKKPMWTNAAHSGK
jgi:ribosomal RNA-processing protein 9